MPNSQKNNSGLPADLLSAIRHRDTEHLDLHLVSAKDFRPPRSPAIPTGRLAQEAAAWEDRVRRAVGESLRYVSAYGDLVGIDWMTATTGRVLAGAKFGEGREIQGTDVEVWCIGIEFPAGAREILVLLPVQPTRRGVRINRPIAATILSSEERARLRKWQPGVDKQEDLSVVSLLVEKKATRGYLSMFGWFYTHEGEAWVFKEATTVKLEFEGGVVQRAVVDGTTVGEDADG